MPKVSILVPIFNVEKYLRQCLDSIVAQTMTDIEIICINDGSTDSCPQILDEYAQKDARIKIISKPNSGYGNSMNQGIDAATGEYIGIVESDDYAELNMFECLYQLAQEHDADLVKSEHIAFNTTRDESRVTADTKTEHLHRVLNASEEPSLLENFIPIWRSIYRNSFIQANGIRFLETPGASYQDTSFGFKTLALAKRIFITNQAFLHYRTDNENSSVNSKGKVYMVCTEFDEIAAFLNKHPELKASLGEVRTLNLYRHYAWNLLRIHPQFQGEFIKVFSKTLNQLKKSGELSSSVRDEITHRKMFNKIAFSLLLSCPSLYANLLRLGMIINNKLK